MDWHPYDPTWLTLLVKALHPQEPWLAEALMTCTTAAAEGRAYLRFADPNSPNRLDSEWQFERSIMLEHPTEGTLVLDVLRGGRVGGVEFLNRL